MKRKEKEVNNSLGESQGKVSLDLAKGEGRSCATSKN